MASSSEVVSYVLLRNNQIFVDGKLLFEKNDISSTDFLNAAYESLQINYPKFYKMDNLCKTGFLVTELLLRGQNLNQQFSPEDTGIVFSNANSSLDTDLRYQLSTAGMPSPGLFVYTLPNVLIGEICIRHQIKGESACFVFDIFDAAFQTEYINSLFETEKIKSCISGWADYYDGNAEAFFYLAQPTNDTRYPKHDSITVQKFFESK